MKNLIDYIQEGLKITADTEIEDLYNEEGIYAYFKDKTLSSDESYIKKHRKDAIGVAVIVKVDGEFHRIVIDKTNISDKKVYYGGFNKSVSGATTTEDETIAMKDMNGKSNTIAISDACHGYYDGYRTGSAAEDCQAMFDGQGYLPALGELDIIYNRKDDINKMIELIGGDIMDAYYYCASTLYNATYAWYADWTNGSSKTLYRGNTSPVRAIMEI